METKIKEVQNYFKKKIVNGDYAVINQDQYTATILIDNKYKFHFWINHKREGFEQYKSITGNFIDLGLLTQSEKFKSFPKMMKIVNEMRKKELEKATLKEYNRMKKELEKAKLI